MKKTIAGVGALLAVATATCPVAAADVSFVRTEVEWAGAACIDMTFNDAASLYTYTKAVCSRNGTYSLTESNVWPGDEIGVDPIMGAAGYIQCRVYINGVLAWSDSAYRGDGSDVNCRRMKL